MTSRRWLAIFATLGLVSCGGGGGMHVAPATGPVAASATRATATLILKIPARSAARQSRRPAYISVSSQSGKISVSAAGTTTSTTFGLGPTSPNCSSASGSFVCTVAFAAPVGTDTFTVVLYDGPNAGGNVLSQSSFVSTILDNATNHISAALGGVVAQVALTMNPPGLALGTPATANLMVQAVDADANFIIGSEPYVDAAGNPIVFALAKTDPLGVLALSATSVTSPANATIAATYNGSSAPGNNATIPLSLSGGTLQARNALLLGSVGKSIYIMNGSDASLRVFAPGATGNTLPIRTLQSTLVYPAGMAFDQSGNLYVADTGANQYLGAINVYAPGIANNAAPIRTISGSNTGLNYPLGIALDSQGNIYVANQSTSAITVYANSASGNVSPIRTISGAATTIFYANAVVLDASNNLIVAAETSNSYNYALLFFPAGSSGNVAPTRTIGGIATGLTYPTGLAVDANGNTYAANSWNGASASVGIFAAGASGNVAPTASLAGSNFGIVNPTDVKLDASGSIYVTGLVGSVWTVSVFAAGTTGNVAPIRSFGNGNNGLFQYLAIAANNDVYVADDNFLAVYRYASTASGNAVPTRTIASGFAYPTNPSFDGTGRMAIADSIFQNINFYAPGSNGFANPIATIAGPATGLDRVLATAFDAAGYLYVAEHNATYPAFPTDAILVFAPGAVGNIAPIRVIGGTNTMLHYPLGLALDGAGTIYVANNGANSVVTFAAGANGNVAPTSIVSGTATNLSFPRSIALDLTGNMYVLNSSVESVVVFPRTASGNVAPTRTLIGAATLISGSSWIAVDSAGTLYVLDAFTNTTSLLQFAVGANGNVAPSGVLTGSATGLYHPGGFSLGP